ncbi:hypothetical protein HTZ77_33145 [Nonomuraea sp. SMC257]|uniref:Uncharacterized protein n=1 Tax=Nonomuraea montanisoli TaxID=2741721 RepID=A0A7Y6IDF2_9ACTN|nr:hypothetical protein [Nonomuraea montanisoli]NUW36223.1 hypothetical protein [Nonomuraea montanisoli]
MDALRDELHALVDQLPEDKVAPVIALVRQNLGMSERRARAVSTPARIQSRLHGVEGVDEELNRLRDGSRG